jgi:hypothetical protein
MNRIIRTVLASVGAAAVVSGGALGVAYATSPAPAQTSNKGTNAGADLNKAADELAAQIEKLQKDLSEPMPTLTTATPTPEAQSDARPATTRAAAKAPAAPTAAAQTTQHGDSGDKSGDSKKKESND